MIRVSFCYGIEWPGRYLDDWDKSTHILIVSPYVVVTSSLNVTATEVAVQLPVAVVVVLVLVDVLVVPVAVLVVLVVVVVDPPAPTPFRWLSSHAKQHHKRNWCPEVKDNIWSRIQINIQHFGGRDPSLTSETSNRIPNSGDLSSLNPTQPPLLLYATRSR